MIQRSPFHKVLSLVWIQTQSKCKAKLLLVSKETTPFNSCSPDITQVRCGSSFSCLYTICNMHKLINNHAETPSCNKDYSDNNKPFKTNYCSKILYQNTLSYWLRSQMSMSNGLWLSGNIDVIKVATLPLPKEECCCHKPILICLRVSANCKMYGKRKPSSKFKELPFNVSF